MAIGTTSYSSYIHLAEWCTAELMEPHVIQGRGELGLSGWGLGLTLGHWSLATVSDTPARLIPTYAYLQPCCLISSVSPFGFRFFPKGPLYSSANKGLWLGTAPSTLTVRIHPRVPRHLLGRVLLQAIGWPSLPCSQPWKCITWEMMLKKQEERAHVSIHRK
jgi:hypothetical protein